MSKAKAQDSDDMFQRAPAEKEDFRYNYCDYDMSANSSTVGETDALVEELEEDETEKFQDKWDFRSKATYYVAPETKNAQTVSIKQRHRPIFQIYVDFNFAIMSTTFLLLSYLVVIRHEPNFKVDKLIYRVGSSVLFFLKFFIFTAWYRWMDVGNILELTQQLFWFRFLYDLTVYSFIAYIVMDITDPEGDVLQYTLMGIMFLKEVYIYF